MSCPFSTKSIGTSVEGVGVDHTLSVVQDVASIAGQTFSVEVVPGGTLVTDGLTNSVIHPPSLGASFADISVPFSTSEVLVGQFAAVIDDGVALIAGLADSFSSVELGAEGGHLATDSLLVEVPPLGALSALVLDPGLAAVMIGDGDDVSQGDARGCGIEAVEISVEGVEGEVGIDQSQSQDESDGYHYLTHIFNIYNQKALPKQISSAQPPPLIYA